MKLKASFKRRMQELNHGEIRSIYVVRELSAEFIHKMTGK